MRSFMPLLTTRRGRILCIVAMLIAFADGDADASPAQAEPDTRSTWQTVSEVRLDRMRGGFDAGGLLVSFGITRMVYLNGALLTETTLNLGQLAQLSPAQAAQLTSQIAGLNLVKVGPGNVAAIDTAGVTMPGIVLQNTLNNQNINVQTMINATSNGLSILRGLNSARTITDAMR